MTALKYFKTLTYAIVICFSNNLSAQDEVPYACLFERTFLFGASITAGYGGLADGTMGLLFRNQGPRIGTQDSPLALMAQEIHGDDTPIINQAEIVNQMPFQSIGFEQFEHYLGSESPSVAAQSYSLLGSLDGFFWPALYGNYACENVIYGAERIIETARESKVPLILGTVPIENTDHIHPLVVAGGLQTGGPRPDCVIRLNKEIKKMCQIQNQCFVIDVYKIVEDLRSEEGIRFEGQTYKAFNFKNFYQTYGEDSNAAQTILASTPMLRFDGVHLSDEGVRYTMSLIDTELRKAPSLCQE